ncbi:L-threonylcarbamoyladenylate synthase [uncultured Veillonella sp.]|uniref:L-threonylcarbamoyladenylate synthase n=1 Tax=uncultured Veillonella sp. TaxID=159268 RepID=UPI00260B30D0|nr:L-threonylcarbamoyladenylate synthase [uncultured Veillonella sp.]
MDTKIYKEFNAQTINELGARLREGQLVAIPTETVYGLGANGLDEAAMSRIYEAKGRPSDNPLILHVPNSEAVIPLVKNVPPVAQALMEAFWPGPLTIIMPKSDRVPLRATGGLPNVALRCPDHEICHNILKAAGVPIAAPSANISGRPSPTTAEDVYRDMKGRIEAIADAGPCEVGLESTIVECHSGGVTILRPGAITKDMLEEVVGQVDFDEALTAPDVTPKAPGMKYKHYAPDANLITLVGPVLEVTRTLGLILETRGRFASCLKHYYEPEGCCIMTDPISDALVELRKLVIPFGADEKIGLLLSEEVAHELKGTLKNLSVPYHLIVYGKAHEYKSLARILYRSLLEFNEQKVTRIFATGVEAKGLGKAIMNRLDKASAHHVIQVEPYTS